MVLLFIAAGCSNTALEADAGQDFSVSVGESPEFNGCDSAGDIERYEWIIRDAPASGAAAIGTTLSANTTCTHTVDAMSVNDVGTWTVELIVADADGQTSIDQVQVTVS